MIIWFDRWRFHLKDVYVMGGNEKEILNK